MLLTSLESFVKLYYDGCHNSMNFLKNIKIDEFFCSHFNIESGRKKATFFWHIMLYYFKKGKNTTETQQKDLSSIWKRCCDCWMYQKWLAKFRTEISCWMVLQSQCYSTWERANILKISKLGIENHLHQLGYVSHFGVWVPHKLSKRLYFHTGFFT